MSDSFTASANGKNQLNTYSYDASGNLQNDQLGHTFNYDGGWPSFPLAQTRQWVPHPSRALCEGWVAG